MKRKKLKYVMSFKKDSIAMKRAIHLKWGDSFDYFPDGYIECTETNDPLFSYYPSKSEYVLLIRTREFRRRKRNANS